MAIYYWVGGSGTWDNSNTANWSSTSGGAGGAGYPVAGDTAILNATSGAAVVTLGTNVTLNILTMTGFTGTLAFSTFGISLVSTASSQIVYTGGSTYTVTGTDPTITVTVTGVHNDITFAAGAATEANAINAVGYGSTFNAAWTVSGNVKDMLSYGLLIYNVNRTVYRNYGQFPNAGNASRSGSGNNSQTTFAGSGTQTITCNGNEIGHWVGFSGTGTIVFADAFLLNVSRTLVHTSGTINANNMNVTVGNFTSTGATARTINMGSGTWTLLSSTWTISGSNYTVNCNTSTVLIAIATTNCNFTTGDVTYHNIIFQGGVGSVCNFASTTSVTVNNISNNVAPARIVLSNNTTLFVNGDFNFNGTTVDDVLLAGSSEVNRAIISKASGTVNCQYLGIGNLIFQGGASWNANHSWANNSTGITITNTDTRYWVGGSGTWDSSTTTNWSLTSNGAGGASVPTTATRVVFSSESGGGTVTIGTGATCRILLFQNAYFNVAGQHSGTVAFGSNFIDVAGETRTVVKGGTTTAFTGTGGIRLTANATSGRRECQSQSSTEANAPRFWVTAGTDTVTVFEFSKSLNFTGFSGTLSNASRTVYGDFVGSPTMTHSASGGAMSMRSSVPAIIDCAGCTLGQPVTINSTSTYTLSSTLTMNTSRLFTLTAGTFNSNNYNVTCGSTSIAAGTTLTMGSSTWNIFTQWSIAAGATFNCGTSTVNMINTSAASFAGGGYTYYNLSGSGTAQINILSGGTFNDITHTNPPVTFNVTAGVVLTVTNFSLSGILNDIITLQSATAGSPFTLSKASGTVNVSYLSIKDCTASGGATWNATYSTSVSGNSGWNSITNTAATYYWVGGSGTWDGSSTANWSLTSGGANNAGCPNINDIVIINASSGGGTITLGANVSCKTLNMTGFTGTFAFGANKISIGGAAATVYTGDTTYSCTGSERLDLVYPGRVGTRTVASSVSITEANAVSLYVTGGSDNFTTTSNHRFGTIDLTGFRGIWTNTARQLFGSLVLSSLMTPPSGNQSTSFIGSGANVFNPAGISYSHSVVVDGAGSVTLQNHLTISGYGVTVTSGTFDPASYNVTCTALLSTGVVSRTINMGSGNWYLSSSASGYALNFTNTGLTVNKGTASVHLIGATVTQPVNLAGHSISRLVISTTGKVRFQSSGGVDTLDNTVPAEISIIAGQTLTCQTAVNLAGNVSTQSRLYSETPGSIAYISASTGVVVNPEYLTITDVGAMGGAKWDTYGNPGNINGGNSPGWLWYQSNVDNAAFMGFF